MSKYVAMAALAVASVHGFAVPSTTQLGLRSGAARSISMPEISMVASTSRRDVLFAAAASLALGSAPAGAVENAKCTFQSCPAPTGALTLELLEVNAGKFTGKGYSLSKPTEDTFKRVISPSSLASPGGILFRDKLDAETAVFCVVQEVKKGAGEWKPNLIASYMKEFGKRFQLIKQEGPVKKGGADFYFFEYTVETTISGAQVLVHYYSTFAAGEKNVYIVNAQTKQTNFELMGKTLEKVAKSLVVNE